MKWIVKVTDNKTHKIQRKKFPKLDKAVEYANQIYNEFGRGKLKSTYIEKE